MAGALLMVLPMLWMLATSFKPPTEIDIWPPQWLPRAPSWYNYVGIFKAAPFGRFFLNSVGTSLVATLSVALTSLVAGAVFAKYSFPGRRLLFQLIIATAIVPFEAYMIPLYIELVRIHWINTYQAIILPTLVMSFGIFLVRQHVASAIPDELMEAARVDGAGEFHIFLRIVLPLLVPALASLAIIVFIWSWGNFLWPLVIVQDKDLNVLSVGMTSYSQPYQREPMWAAAMAASTVATLPIAALFVFFQRYFVKGLTAAAVKG